MDCCNLILILNAITWQLIKEHLLYIAKCKAYKNIIQHQTSDLILFVQTSSKLTRESKPSDILPFCQNADGCLSLGYSLELHSQLGLV